MRYAVDRDLFAPEKRAEHISTSIFISLTPANPVANFATYQGG